MAYKLLIKYLLIRLILDHNLYIYRFVCEVSVSMFVGNASSTEDARPSGTGAGQARVSQAAAA
jgi:hypothetical protein